MSQKTAKKTAKPKIEVVPKAKRRQFSPAYKKRILTEVSACTEAGQIGAILRREGLYSSHLNTWRKQEERGELNGQTSPKRGRPAQSENEQELSRLQEENEGLKQRLSQLEAIIDIQKKVSELLGLSWPQSQTEGKK